MPTEKDDHAALRTAYAELSASYRAIDDFRMKLLGLLPLATGGGLILVAGRLDGDLFLPVGIFGAAVTMGLFVFEVYGIKKCYRLIETGKRMEQSLGLEMGQFEDRPSCLRDYYVSKPVATAVIYPSVMAAWTYVAVLNTPAVAAVLAVLVFLAGFAVTLAYDHRLCREARNRVADERLSHQRPTELSSAPAAD